MAYDPKKIRGSMIAKEAKAKGIDGVVFAMMKFCDPEEYDYPIVKKTLKRRHSYNYDRSRPTKQEC